jgi:hypothetical protein
LSEIAVLKQISRNCTGAPPHFDGVTPGVLPLLIFINSPDWLGIRIAKLAASRLWLVVAESGKR